MYSVGVDIGATKTNFVLVSGQKIVRKENFLTPKNQKGFLRDIKAELKEMLSGLPKSKIKGIGLGAAGPLNKTRTLLLNPANLAYFNNYPLAGAIQKYLKIKTVMENDSNCFALAESLIGAGKGAKTVLGVTLGTGVGGGIVINGKIHTGAFGAAGEIGHMTINYNGLKCSCGNFGCLEEYASERFFIRRGAYPFAFHKKAERGDKRALNIYREYGRYLGAGISGCINLLDPEVVVIGGGISGSYRFFADSAKKEISRRVISQSTKKYVKIKKAELGSWSGAVGAALLVHSVK